MHATYIHEKQTLDASNAAALSNASNSLNTLHADGTFLIRKGCAFSLGYFSTTGSSDALLYAPAPVTGAAGRPNSDGWIGRFSYWPWQNMQFSLQETYYGKFNGASSNYDGGGRSASDNNTLFLMAMFVF